MKKTLSLLTLVLAVTMAFSQHEHKFGNISKPESDLKTCAFDPEAAAVVLLKEAYSEYGAENELLTYYHVKIKILKEDGERFGDISIRYRSENDFENVDNVEAVTIKLDDNGNRKDIPELRHQESRGGKPADNAAIRF